MSRIQDYFRGCLMGGAIGDALGWPVELLQYDQIMSRFGDCGIQDLVLSSTGKAEITDDIQMTLFTAEGILRSDHEECTESLKRALDLSNSDLSDIDSISRLGEGWIGEEALAISVYCALRYRDNFKNG